MVVIQANVSQQSKRNIFLQAAANDTMMKLTVIPIQEMNRKYIMILQKKKVILENYVTTRK